VRIEQLGYLVATVEHGTMTGAAAAVHVSQPALTRSVRGLERELGVPLLQRAGNRLVPTEAGARVVDAARRILADVQTIEAVVRDDVVRVRTTPRQERELVRGAVARMLAAGDPTTVLVTTSEEAAAVSDAVAAGQADIGVCDHPEAALLPSVVLGWQETLLICPGHWAVPDPVTAEWLSEVPLVVPSPGTTRRARMDAGLAGLGITPTIAAVTDQADLGVSLALGGLVAAFGYASAATEAEARGARVVRLEPAIRRPVGYVHADGRLARPARAFLDALRAEAADVLDVDVSRPAPA
jgi:LysR family cyn operon transcriptional activator